MEMQLHAHYVYDELLEEILTSRLTHERILSTYRNDLRFNPNLIFAINQRISSGINSEALSSLLEYILPQVSINAWRLIVDNETFGSKTVFNQWFFFLGNHHAWAFMQGYISQKGNPGLSEHVRKLKTMLGEITTQFILRMKYLEEVEALIRTCNNFFQDLSFYNLATDVIQAQDSLLSCQKAFLWSIEIYKYNPLNEEIFNQLFRIVSNISKLGFNDIAARYAMDTLTARVLNFDETNEYKDHLLKLMDLGMSIVPRSIDSFYWAVARFNKASILFQVTCKETVSDQEIHALLDSALEVIHIEEHPRIWCDIKCLYARTLASIKIKDGQPYFRQAISNCDEMLIQLSNSGHDNLIPLVLDQKSLIIALESKGDKRKTKSDALSSHLEYMRAAKLDEGSFDWADAQLKKGELLLKAHVKDANSYHEALESFDLAQSFFSPDNYPNHYYKCLTLMAQTVEELDTEHKDMSAEIVDAYYAALEYYQDKKNKREWYRTSVHLCYYLSKLYTSTKNIDYRDQILNILNESMLEGSKQDSSSTYAAAKMILAEISFLERPNAAIIEDSTLNGYLDTLAVVDQSKDPDEYAELCQTIGMIYYNKNEMSNAIMYFELTHNSLELIWSLNYLKLADTNQRLSGKFNNTYKFLVSALLSEGKFERAFHYVLVSKGRNNADVLNSSFKSSPRYQHNQEHQDLKNKLFELSDMINQIRSGKFVQSTELNNLHAQLIKERTGLQEELLVKFPLLDNEIDYVKVDIPGLLSLSLELDAALIEFYDSWTHWIAFVIVKGELHLVEYGTDFNDAAMEFLVWSTDNDHFIPAALGSIRQRRILEQMYKCIIEPLNPYINSCDQVVIAPSGLTHRIPFGIAMHQESRRLFNQEHELYFVPSMMYALALQRRNHLGKHSIGNTDREKLIVSHSGLGHNTLTYTKSEVAAIDKLFDRRSIMLSEEEATPEKVIHELSNKTFDFIHFSCHGSFSYDLVELSGLMLNGCLTIEMIEDKLKLKGNPLVVMSACKSSISGILSGDEMIGLTHAWLNAGAGTVIGSLWCVDDASTSLLFQTYYKNRLDTEVSQPEALRDAMKLIANQTRYKSPFYWGAFQVYGIPTLA